MRMIAIIDYDAGNIKSVEKALLYLGQEVKITSAPSEILSADKVILPGVGAFGDAMEQLKKYELDKVIHQVTAENKPFLGICLGLQLLFEGSDESQGVEGLHVLDGQILRIPDQSGLKIPHIGWNSTDIKKPCPIYDGIADGSFVYFVHSYYLDAENRSDVATKTEYGISFDSSVAVPEINLYATQFHPEKSGRVGLKILENFAKLGGDALVR